MTRRIRVSEKRKVVLLLLLCLLPVGVAAFIEQRRATLAKYTGAVPLGGSGFVRLHANGLGAGSELSWSIHLTGLRPPLQMDSDGPRGWKVEFIEELPHQDGARSVGVKVTAPHHAREAVGARPFATLLHTRDGAPFLFAGSIRVLPATNPKGTR